VTEATEINVDSEVDHMPAQMESGTTVTDETPREVRCACSGHGH